MNLRVSEYLAPVSRLLDALVHPEVATNRREFGRHRAFILANLSGGVTALALLPLALALLGPITLPLILVAAWLIGQLPIAMYLSRSGSFAGAHLASALLFSAFIGTLSALTGGVHSFALVWLAIAPLEAALSGRRKVIVIAATASVAIVIALAVAGSQALPQFTLPLGAPGGDMPLVVSTVAALIYAVVLALRIDWDHRHGLALLDEREAKYRLVAENVTDVITLHRWDGEVLFTTPSIQAVLGISRASAAGGGLFQRVHVADRPAYLKAISDARNQGTPSTIEFRFRRGGSDEGRPDYIWLEMNARIVDQALPGVAADCNGGQIVAVLRDVSDRKANEIALGEARVQAEAASDAKTRFLANVSHELRTPLNAIIGFSDLLRHSPGLMQNTGKGMEYIDLIHDSGRHLLQVVNDILDMSKIETGNFDLFVEPFDVSQCVESCRRMIEGEAGKRGVVLVADLPSALGEFPADRRACKQIVLNLLSNAVKFSEKGGEVCVSARLERDDLVIRVRDTGIGIAEADVKMLGMPFFQANAGYNRSHEGTGLGLSVVKGLAELHGGTVLFDSRLGAGTTVTVRLPRPVETVNGQQRREDLPAAPVSARKIA